MSYEQWLAQQGAYRCVLVELDYIDAGTLKTACFSSAAFVSAGTDTPAHTAYDPFVVGGLDFERSLAEVFTGASSVRLADIELLSLPATQWLITADVAGRPVRVYLGAPTWPKADFQQIIAGVCDGVWPEQNSLRIQFRDMAKKLAQQLLTDRYTDGTAEGELKPLCLGRCYNIKPILIDAANHVYQFNCVASVDVTAVRFNGDTVNPSQYTLDLAASTITFTTFPIGEITADVDGAVIGGVWLQTATQFISYLASRFGIAADISGLPAYLLGLYITDDTTLDTLLDDICASVSGYWLFDRSGQFKVRHFNGIPDIKTAVITDAQNLFGTRLPRRRIPARHSVTLGYARNWHPLTAIAASVHETAPAEAKLLSAQEQTVPVSDPAISAAYSDSEVVKATSLIVNKEDAETEATNRLALGAVPRWIYETQQLATPFAWQLGDGAELTRPGVNGAAAVLTKISENPLKGICTVEFWQ